MESPLQTGLGRAIGVLTIALDDTVPVPAQPSQTQQFVRYDLVAFLDVLTPFGADDMLPDDHKTRCIETGFEVALDEIGHDVAEGFMDRGRLDRVDWPMQDIGVGDQVSVRAEHSAHLSQGRREVGQDLDHIAAPPSAVVFVAWYGALERLGVEKTGLFNGLIPIASLVAVALVGTGTATPLRMAGAVAVLLGVVLGLTGAKRVRPPSTPAQVSESRQTCVRG